MLRMCSPSHGRQLVIRVHDYLEDIHPGLSRIMVGGAVVAGALCYVGVRGYRYYHSVQTGQERKRAAEQALQDLKDYLHQRELAEGPVNREKEAMIVALPFTELRDKLHKGELTALQVLRAFQRKALAVNDQLNCITEPIVEAEARAKELDRLKPEERGPLHGIPVSIKDSIFLKGYDCNIGFACLCGKLADTDADIVQLLKHLGAVPFVRTNFPQGLLSIACNNPIYGRTKNPYDHERGPGGSSGGEGALIGAGGSILGIGSDIAGSIRIPANMCGAYGLKPTVDRFMWTGHLPLLKGQAAVHPTMGPLARDMDGLIEVTRILYTPPLMQELDPTVPPFPFNEELFEKKGPLRIGFYTTIDKVTPHPACVRAVMEAKAALERKGHKVVPFTPHGALHAFSVLEIQAIMSGDGSDTVQLLTNDRVDVCLQTFYYVGKLPPPVKYLVCKLMALKDPLSSEMFLAWCKGPQTVADWWRLCGKIMDYKKEFHAAWKKEKLDAILCPTVPYPPLIAGTEEVCFYSLVYTALYNVLNYPAGVVPVTKVTQQDVQNLRDPAAYPRSGFFEKFIVKTFDGAVGIPVGVQVAALPFQEEMVLRVMKDIDTSIKK